MCVLCYCVEAAKQSEINYKEAVTIFFYFLKKQTLVGPTRKNLDPNPLTVVSLNNQLLILKIKNYILFISGQEACATPNPRLTVPRIIAAKVAFAPHSKCATLMHVRFFGKFIFSMKSTSLH